MKNLSILFIIPLLFLSTYQLKAQNSSQDSKKIAILGMFHFGKTSDMSAIVMEDIQGEQRQTEIKALVELLAQYKPDRILLEYPLDRDSFFLIRYQQYLQGEHELTVNERQQIGFRLAKKLGHRRVYGVDYKMELPFEKISKYAQENDKGYLMENLGVMVGNFTGRESEKLKTMELSAYLSHMNSLEMDRFSNSLYLKEILAFGDLENPAGAAMAAAWYQRNMVILQNIDQRTKPGEKVLVIIGGAHRAVLRDFIEDRVDMEFVEISGFLKK